MLEAFFLSAAEPEAPANDSAETVIVVTGRGLPGARGEEAYGLARIGRERLENAPSNRLEEVLRDVPGFQLFRRSDARSANPTSQGATLRALGGNASSRALPILDGVPQTDPFGGWISWPAYDARRLGEVRVVRGGGSGAHGPGALAGTIELVSADSSQLDRVSAALAYGSRDGIDAFAGLALPLGEGFLTFSAAGARGNGFVPVVAGQRGPADRPARYAQASAALRAVAPLAPALELQANLAAFRDSRERGTAFSDILTEGADASLRLVGGGALPFSFLAYAQLRGFANRFAAATPDRTAVNLTLDQYSVPSTGLGARAELRPRLGPAELRLGADWRLSEGSTSELFQFVAGAPTRHRSAGGRSATLGAFAELGWESGPLQLTGGARLDRWWVEGGFFREHVLAGGEVLSDEAFPNRRGWRPTARAGLAWRAAEPLTLRAATYLGWRLPTLNEFYRPFRVGPDATAANAALTPERLRGAEAGLELRPAPGARIGLTLFVNRLEDAIANVTLGRGPGTFPGVGFVAGEYRQRRNLEAVESRGAELDASIAFGRFSLSGGYSLVRARVRASGAAASLAGLRPAQTPRHAFAATLAWSRPGGGHASLGARHAGGQYEDDLNRQLIPSALTFDSVAVLPLSPRLSLEARAENLTDARVVAGISGAGIVERATPRTLWIGIRLR